MLIVQKTYSVTIQKVFFTSVITFTRWGYNNGIWCRQQNNYIPSRWLKHSHSWITQKNKCKYAFLSQMCTILHLDEKMNCLFRSISSLVAALSLIIRISTLQNGSRTIPVDHSCRKSSQTVVKSQYLEGQFKSLNLEIARSGKFLRSHWSVFLPVFFQYCSQK